MSAVAVFVYQDWLNLFPALANTGPDQAASYFSLAGLYLNNTGWGGKVRDPTAQLQLMQLLTAHIAFLMNGDTTNPAASPAVVGHMDSANQGSVSIQTSIASNVPLEASWFTQTQYGLMFWQATAQYRTASFRASYRSPLVYGPFGGGPGFGRAGI